MHFFRNPIGLFRPSRKMYVGVFGLRHQMCFFENALNEHVCFQNMINTFEKMHSASNFENDFHMDVKVICNDDTIIQKPLPRVTESA